MTLYGVRQDIETTIDLNVEVDSVLAIPGQIMPGTTYDLMLIEFTIYCMKGATEFQIKEVFEVNGGDVIARNHEKILKIIQEIRDKLDT